MAKSLKASRCILCLCLLSAVSSAAAPHLKLTSWKQYSNKQWGYCVSYPSRWFKGEAFDGSGIFVATGLKKHARPVGEIDVAPVPAEPAHPTVISLTDNFELHLEGLRKFVRAEHLEVLENHPMQLGGNSALFTKDRYFDPQDRASWADEILLVKNADTLYRLELECRSDQLTLFEPVFTHIVSTLRFDCTR